MKHTVENEFLRVEVAETGAELQSIISKNSGKELLWQGDEKYWARRAPILFPIVGRLKNDTMYFGGKEYSMPQHGFARDLHFKVDQISPEYIELSCQSTPETKMHYPFDWKLNCVFKLEGNILKSSATVTNLSDHDLMYFSIGFHPGFVLPVDENLSYEDYYILFNKDKTAKRWKIEGALIGNQEDGDSITDYKVRLTKDIFSIDALVYKNLQSDVITIQNPVTNSELRFSFAGFPFLGIWSKPGAPYICLEPWHGIADSIHHNGDFISKEGINCLSGLQSFHCGYSVEFIL